MEDRAFREHDAKKGFYTKVFQRDDYSCQICLTKGTRLNAHHLDGYHWCIEKRTDINNGITLCEKCHKEFHKIFSNKNNTEQQMSEFRTMKGLS